MNEMKRTKEINISNETKVVISYNNFDVKCRGQFGGDIIVEFHSVHRNDNFRSTRRQIMRITTHRSDKFWRGKWRAGADIFLTLECHSVANDLVHAICIYA